MDRVKVSAMLAMLKYASTRGRDMEKKKDSAKALEVYQMATQPADKAAFLKAFEENGGGRNTESLKFVWSYTSEISASKEKEHGIHEGLFTRPFCFIHSYSRLGIPTLASSHFLG